MITAIVTSDNHLGLYYAQMRPDRLEQRRQRLRNAFARVVDEAIERQVDVFLHAGDLFDQPNPRNSERRFVAMQLQRLKNAGIPIAAIAGNHDSLRNYGYDGGVTPHEEMAALNAMQFFRKTDDLEAITLTIRGQRVRVWGMTSDFNRPAEVCPLETVVQLRERPGDIDIVLLHYSMEGWMQSFVQEPCLSRANLTRLQADAICVGHLHAHNEMRLESGALLLNPGATERMEFGEENLESGFYVLQLEPGRAECQYIRLQAQPMRTLKLLIPDGLPRIAASQEEEIVAELMSRFQQDIDAVCNVDQLLRIRLIGQISRTLMQGLDLLALETQGRAQNFHCQLDAEDLITYDPISDLPLSGGVGFDIPAELQRAARECAEQSGDDPTEKELFLLAGKSLAAAYDRLTKGA